MVVLGGLACGHAWDGCSGRRRDPANKNSSNFVGWEVKMRISVNFQPGVWKEQTIINLAKRSGCKDLLSQVGKDTCLSAGKVDFSTWTLFGQRSR